jgi:hypothetical protein
MPVPDMLGRPYQVIPCDFNSVIMHFSTQMERSAVATSDGVSDGSHFFAVSVVNSLEALWSHKFCEKNPTAKLKDYGGYNKKEGTHQAGYGFAVMVMDSLGGSEAPRTLKVNIALTSILMSASAVRMGVRLPENVTLQNGEAIPVMKGISSASAALVARLHFRKIECVQQVGSMCAVNAATNCLHLLSLSRGSLIQNNRVWYPHPSCLLTSCGQPALCENVHNHGKAMGCTPVEAERTLYWIRRKIFESVGIQMPKAQKESLSKLLQNHEAGNKQDKNCDSSLAFSNMVKTCTQYYSSLDLSKPCIVVVSDD